MDRRIDRRPKAWADDRCITGDSFMVCVLRINSQANSLHQADLGLGIKFKMLFLWPEISHSSSWCSSRRNNEFSSWNLSSVAITRRHLESATVNLLISFSLNPELINSHSGRLCCCSASPSRETNQTMGVIERRNRWHYWILITSFPRQRRTWQLPGYKMRVCVRWSVCIGRGWSARQMTGSSGSHSGWKKVVSGYQRTQPCLDGSLLSQRGELLPYGEGPNYPPPMAESTFDYILPKAALKGSIQIPLLCLFSHNQEWLLFPNDKFNFFF